MKSAPSASALRREVLLVPGLVTTALFLAFGQDWLGRLENTGLAVALFAWLFGAILISAFGVVRHADCLAIRLGEPYGTLILTLAVIGMEVMMVAAVMLGGTPDPAMARDTMFAVLMIVLNGLLGVALLAGGLRHHEQEYNLQGAVAFLSMLVPLGAAALILPAHLSAAGPGLAKLRATAMIVTTVGLYGAFLAVQTRRHPEHFTEPEGADGEADAGHAGAGVRSLGFHAGLLVAYLLPVIVLAKKLALVLEFGAARLGTPPALSGVVVATLILFPEGMAGVRAALANRPQRAVNLLFGAALSTVALTVPAVLAISLATGRPVVLGLSEANQILLAVTLVVGTLTCATGRTNVLNGLIHLVLFVAYLILIFEG